jgi:WhiB family redox-sensing transcriptional regulator
MRSVEESSYSDKLWPLKAACKNEDPEVFFPASEKDPNSREIRFAKDICARCIVVDRCLEMALRNRETVGIWGRLSTPEREAILRRKSRAS